MRRKNSNGDAKHLNFSSVSQGAVPHSRKGKHRQIVVDILNDVETVPAGAAVKIPRDQLGSSIANVRSALNRASKKRDYELATAADADDLYVWRKALPKQ